ncbi:MAG TPA: hypothetical protein VFC51_09480 [Chloroflexota bacterium]|nr:hypothetical protein [Chloroflexota bacterium]
MRRRHLDGRELPQQPRRRRALTRSCQLVHHAAAVAWRARREAGQDITEYALILSAVLCVALFVLVTFAPGVLGLYARFHAGIRMIEAMAVPDPTNTPFPYRISTPTPGPTSGPTSTPVLPSETP